MTYRDPEIEAELQRMKIELNISGNKNHHGNDSSKKEYSPNFSERSGIFFCAKILSVL